MEPTIDEELKNFSPKYISSHEFFSFIEKIVDDLEALDKYHKAYLIAGLIEKVYSIGIQEGIDKALRRLALVVKHGTELPKTGQNKSQ